MTSDTFKNMYKDFINELMTEFPDVERIKDEKLKFMTYEGDHMKRYMKRLHIPSDFTSMITNKSEALFKSKCKLVKDIGLDKIWSRADDKTKDTIWQYLSTMHLLSNTVSTIPPKMLKNIEQMASKLTKDMQLEEGGQMDLPAIMKGVEKMMKEGGMEDMLNQRK